MPARKSASKPAAPRVDPMVTAKAELEAFWGGSNGGGEAYERLNQALGELKLSKPQLEKLRLSLPVTETGTGTTEAKIRRAAQCLRLRELEV